MKVKVLSRLFIENITQEEPYVLISFYCPGDSGPKYKFDTKRKEILRIEIDDVDDINFAKKYNYKILNDDQAKQIINFVEKWKNEINLIICQCDAGISRSSGCAAAISKILNGTDEEIFNNKMYKPNMHIYRTILINNYGIATE